MGDTDTTFHVVCRECDTEEITPSEQDAQRIADSHASAADHRVAVGRVDGGVEG